MGFPKRLLVVVATSAASLAWGQANYLGLLRPPQSALSAGTGFYSFASPTLLGLSPTLSENGYRLKLGYKATSYLSIEGEYVDYGRLTNPFASPASLDSGFRSTGFGVNTVATLPVWSKFSLYGRLGAYRGEARPAFAPYYASLLSDGAARGTRVRYGLGLRYDFTKAFGIRAELERYSPLGSPLASDTESDLFSVGVMWRF